MLKTILVVLLGVVFIGCGKKQEVKMDAKSAVKHAGYHQESKGSSSTKVDAKTAATAKIPIVRKAKKDEIGKAVVCPVMGSKFDVKEFTEVVDYKGKSYYFCCGGCPGSFKKNPEKYINN